MTNTPNLALPYIDAAQAQKHVTHNEALRGLDALVQTAIVTRALAAAPGAPADGACYILNAAGTGGWAGQPAATVAAWQDGIWVFYPPKTGWLAWVADEATTVTYTGTAWQIFGVPPSVPQLGINTTADATNRLAVKSPAILFDNTGNGAQVKINKAAATDTASLLYQDGYSGRAEMGLASDDDFHLKVSPDGSVWKEALRIDRTSGLASAFGDPAVALGIATKQYVDAHSGLVTPGGSSGQIQYNNAGALGGFTASGDASINGATGAVTIAANVVTNAKAAQMAAGTLKGNSTGASANPADLSAAQAKALLAISSADVSGLGALAAASSVSLTSQATGTLQAAQEPAHTGDVTNPAGSLALTIAANAVTNAKAAQMAAATLKGNNTGAVANALDLTAAQVKALLTIAAADVSGLATIAATGNASDALWANSVPQVGINTTADATNKLAVASAASLFNHTGAGHQLKLNKAAAANTASVLYQDNFSGRAEIGLTGDDNFHFKVSPDGATFKEALLLDRTSGLGTVFGDPAVALGIATKQYVDARSGGAAAITEIEIDFGASAVRSKKFLISDAAVLASSKVVPQQSGKAATGRQADENEMDMLHLRAAPAAGTFTLYAACLTGRVNGKRSIIKLDEDDMATLQDVTGANTANVTTNSELAVALSKVLANAGYAAALGEAHDGAAGLPALRRAIYASPEKRLAVGMESLLWDDNFNHTVLNSRKYSANLSTMTAAVAAGFLTLNSGASAASAAAASLRTYRSFPILGNYPTTADFWFSLALVPQAQNNIEIGIGIPNASNVSPPTDGIYLLIDTAGALQLVANYNATTTSSGAIAFAWTANKVYHGEIVCHSDRIELYLDGILYGAVLRAAANTVGAMSQNQSGYLFARLHNVAATAGAQKLNIARWAVTLGDGLFERPWGATRMGMGDNLQSTPDSVAVAPLDNFTNNTAPVSATLNNSVAGYAKPGGQFQFAAVAGSETDYALFAYQLPVPSAAAPGKTMVITGIDIDAFNMGAATATTATLLEWHVGTGATAVALSTADAATTRAPYRKFLGVQTFPVGTAIGARADRALSADFSTAPLMVEAGTFLHIILRIPVGTATASQIIRGGVSVKGYLE